MKRQVIVDLILAHYKNDRRLFFDRAIDVLKEFREDDCDKLADWIEFELFTHLKVMPIEEKDNYKEETHDPNIYFEDADVRYIVDEDGNLVPRYSCGIVPQEVEDDDYSVCPKCGSHMIEANKDIANPWIRCMNCGHYLREGKK